MKLDLLSPHIEVGLMTTNLDDTAAFYEGFLELEHQGDIDFPGGAQGRYSSNHEIVEPLTEFAPVPGMGWMFVADPDGNWIELFGTL